MRKDDDKILTEIEKYIGREGCDSYNFLLEYALENKRNWHRVIVEYTEHVQAVLEAYGEAVKRHLVEPPEGSIAWQRLKNIEENGEDLGW